MCLLFQKFWTQFLLWDVMVCFILQYATVPNLFASRDIELMESFCDSLLVEHTIIIIVIIYIQIGCGIGCNSTDF